MDYEKLQEEVARIAVKAGEEIMRIYQEDDFGISEKEDSSPLTRADIASHHIIIEGLAGLTPDIPIVSEEDSQELDRSSLDMLWMVDPLDGTKEFIKQNGEFTVNIALIIDGNPVLGVVYAPALDISYQGIVGVGAKIVKSGHASAMDAIHKAEPPVIIVSRSHRDAHIEKLLEKIGEHQAISMGSSLKLCLVAEGKAMLYPRLAPTMEWDTAAADAVVRAAGGKVLDTNGTPLIYNKTDLHNPYFIAEASNAIDWQILDIF